MKTKKPNAMKHRGIRFSDEQWEQVIKEAAKDKTGRTKPSDVVRVCVARFFSK